MKRITCLLLCLGLLAMASVAEAVEVFSTPTELIKHDESKAQAGVNMFSAGVKKGAGQNWILDNDGQVVNVIYSEGDSGYMQMTHEGHILINGSSAEATATDTYSLYNRGGGRGLIELFKWNGKSLLNLHVYSPDYRQHHEVRRIWNKKLGQYTYLMLVWERMGAEDAVALGTNPVYEAGYANGWSPDAIWEMNDKGELIWRWAFVDHVVQNYDPSKTEPFTDVCGRYNPGSTYGAPADYPRKINLNYKTLLAGPEPDWNHINSLDYNPESGHIVMNSREWSEIYVIDHDGTFVSSTDWAKNIAATQTEAGDFLWRWGAPHIYGAGTAPSYNNAGDQQLFNAHNVQWIGLGCDYDGWEKAMGTIPGHGNILIFDNGQTNPVEHRSRILEINPYDENGDYLWQENGGYTNISVAGIYNRYKVSNMIVWKYQSALCNSFYSSHISSCQRMPNGNTVIDSGNNGHFFEVTTEGEVVWEYINPIITAGASETLDDSQNMTFGLFSQNQVFRVYRVPLKHPGLKGKSLYPRSTITGKTPGSSSSGDSSGGDSGSGGGGAGGGGGGY
jgi:hypothetical protein